MTTGRVKLIGRVALVGLMALALIITTGSTARAEKRSNPLVKLETSMGEITVELYADKAPATAANFLQYVKDGFYNGTIFHRVIPTFMIQGGGFDAQMSQKPTRAPIKNEADNGLKNEPYTVAMARTMDPNIMKRDLLKVCTAKILLKALFARRTTGLYGGSLCIG